MTCRRERPAKRRAVALHGFPLRTMTLTATQTWAAMIGLGELHPQGVRWWVITLPTAIIAVVDAWQELRTSLYMHQDSSIAPNHAAVAPEARHIRAGFPFPPGTGDWKPLPERTILVIPESDPDKPSTP